MKITEQDYILANKKASREEEIEKYGKQILFRHTWYKNKKRYSRKAKHKKNEW